MVGYFSYQLTQIHLGSDCADDESTKRVRNGTRFLGTFVWCSNKSLDPEKSALRRARQRLSTNASLRTAGNLFLRNDQLLSQQHQMRCGMAQGMVSQEKECSVP